MIALLAAATLAVGGPPADLGARIAESAAAAEALQGPLDGAWVLVDGHGHALVDLQLSDPPSGEALAGAWSEPGGRALGPIAAHRRGVSRLQLRWTSGGRRHRLELRHGSGGWRGELDAGGVTTVVRLVRRGPSPPPS